MKAKVQKNGHANLDSFPFRYGFTYDNTERLELTNVRNKGDIVDNRYHIDANFVNPNTDKTEQGHFVMLNDRENTVVTVWGANMDGKEETRLSETLRSARIRGKINTDDMVKMHSLKIRSLDEFIDYLAIKSSTKEIEVINSDANRRVEKLSKALGRLNEDKKSLQSNLDKQDAENIALKRIIEELKSVSRGAYDSRGSGGIWNPGTFTLVSVRWSNKGRNNQRAVMVKLKDSKNYEFEIANNWSDGIQDRYRQAELLVGKTVKYSTFGNYSRDWFLNISDDVHQDNPFDNSFVIRKPAPKVGAITFKIQTVEIVPGNTFNSNWRGNMQKVTTNKGIYIDNITNPENPMLTPGFDWSSIIGTTVYDAVINHSRGRDWINKR